MKASLREAMIHALNALPMHLGERMRFYRHHGYWPKVSAPRTFNEKILARKWFRKDFNFANFADKIEVKKFIAEQVDAGLIVPTLATFTRLSWFDVQQLPVPCVIKCSHDSGSTKVIRSETDKTPELVDFYNQRLLRSTGSLHSEYWYNDIEPRILVERFIDTKSTAFVPEDYKFHYFARTDEIRLQVDYGRFGTHRRGIYNEQGKLLPVKLNYPQANEELPANLPLERMCTYARLIAKQVGLPFLRVDLYCNNGQIYFGEITFAPEAGFGAFTPTQVDHEWGELWG